MDKSEVMGKVFRAVTQVQEASGRPAGDIGSGTRPIRDVSGFDSLSGVEAMVILSESLGHNLPDDCNPFVSQDGRRALTIGEITGSLCEIIGVETESK
jgi:acyl carrier protein